MAPQFNTKYLILKRPTTILTTMTFTKHKLPRSEKLKGATEEVNNK